MAITTLNISIEQRGINSLVVYAESEIGLYPVAHISDKADNEAIHGAWKATRDLAIALNGLTASKFRMPTLIEFQKAINDIPFIGEMETIIL